LKTTLSPLKMTSSGAPALQAWFAGYCGPEVCRLCFFWLRIRSCLVNLESASSPTPPLPWFK